jgi:hypothetical protein
VTGTEHAPTVERPATGRGWIVAATVIGTTIEWYDFFIYTIWRTGDLARLMSVSIAV